MILIDTYCGVRLHSKRNFKNEQDEKRLSKKNKFKIKLFILKKNTKKEQGFLLENVQFKIKKPKEQVTDTSNFFQVTPQDFGKIAVLPNTNTISIC